jgi:hypothetical protein
VGAAPNSNFELVEMALYVGVNVVRPLAHWLYVLAGVYVARQHRGFVSMDTFRVRGCLCCPPAKGFSISLYNSHNHLLFYIIRHFRLLSVFGS